MTLRYPDLTPAMLAVLRIERALEPAYGNNKASPASRQLQHYQCRHCGFFHIGGFGGK